MSKLIKVVILGCLALFTMGNTGCDDKSSYTQNTQVREGNMQRANKAVPVPEIHNFAAREAVAKQVKRMDQKGKLYYIYLISESGAQLGYYVSNTRPVNVCAALTPTEEVTYGETSNTGSNNVVVKAPGLQGTYGSGNCDNSFFFDAATDAYIEFPNSKLGTISDFPLSLKSEPIRIVTEK